VLARPATDASLRDICGRCDILHLSCHGDKESLWIEVDRGQRGSAHLIQVDEVCSIVARARIKPALAFVGACSSFNIAHRMCAAGIPFVVCSTRPVFDTVFKDFTYQFYQRLFMGGGTS